MKPMTTASLHVTPRGVPYCPLSVASAFRDLTTKQRLYAHHMMMAGWCGAPVVASQLSAEALPVLRLFHKLFSVHPPDALKKRAEGVGVTADEVAQVFEYFAMVYSNMGNYLSFGDSKFVPSCPKEIFVKVVNGAGGMNLDPALVESIYDLSEGQLTLAYPPKGVSAYYSANITEEDVLLANVFLTEKRMNGINTRVWKREDGSLVIRVASAVARSVPAEVFRGRSIAFEFGDFQEEMQRVVDHLKKAAEYVENDRQKRMLTHYVEHFMHGDVDAHKASQREWVKDIGPAVEANIGFIETYRDPSGIRAEWEGFVAVVNKDQSKKYGNLVANATKFITQLPWGADFEKDTFSSPDFTSLDIVGFASSGIPSGICIPNYDDVRQDDGFKNVYLSNVVSAINFDDKLNHLSEEDWELYKASFVPAMSVNVGIHELLGHGTGKLLVQREDGTFNFDQSLIDPISGDVVKTWYKPGETWGSIFGGISNSYEECRAEAVALYLCVQPSLLDIFDVKSDVEKRNTIYVCWLNMVRAGLVGLEFYSPETNQWRQAHMRARYCILQTLLRAENPIVRIVPHDTEGIRITLDAARIETDGIRLIGDLLVNLNVNKATANVQRGTEYYSRLTEVDDTFVRYREIIMEKRKPRKQFVQPHTRLEEGDVALEEFAGSVEGVIASFMARHKDVPL